MNNMWKFARHRLRKYGFQEPEACEMLNTLRKAATAIMEKDTQFCYIVNNFIMMKSSVNGIVTEQLLMNFMI